MKFLLVLIEVVMPVYLMVGTGFMAQKWLKLDARTLAQLTYNILLPAFVFEHLHDLQIPVDLAFKSSGLTLSAHLLGIALALLAGYILKLNRAGKTALVMVSLYGNVANMGVPVIRFQYGETAVPSALIYMLVISTLAISVCVLMAEWAVTGTFVKAIPRAILTPPVLAMFPSFLINYFSIPVPLVLLRFFGLLAAAAIPAMLLAMGLQLAGIKKFKWDRKLPYALTVKLVLIPLAVWYFAPLFGIEGIMRSTAIIQAAVPSAALTSIIAIKYDIEADFVTTTVLVSTLYALITLSILLTLI
ncbi:MAG: AEC family transporter [SAR324 cluster bacterium]|nr:AEC family transporter [SAR324 cluster bacterium]